MASSNSDPALTVAAAVGCGLRFQWVLMAEDAIRSMHKHLRRLDLTWVEPSVYFVTICTKDRRPILTKPRVVQIVVEEWSSAPDRYGWHVGRYVVMPDHVHFFCAPELEAKTLSNFIRGWKTWTSRRIHEQFGPQPAAAATTAFWQREFFDHLLRSSESYSEKWNYVRDNPVRAGLVSSAEDWPFGGEIEAFQI